jgi:RNA polymerase sigma factor (sigma-70 family)
MRQEPLGLWFDLNELPWNSAGGAAEAICKDKIHNASDEALDQCFTTITGRAGPKWQKWEEDFVFQWLESRHRGAMRGFASVGLCRGGWHPTQDDVREVVQHVSGVGLYEVIRNFDPKKGNFLGYLHTVLINYGREWADDRARLYFPGDEKLDYFSDASPQDEDEKILVGELVALIAEASPELRSVCAKLMGGSAVKEIAESMGIAAGALRTRLSRARQALQQRLGLRGERQ